jgi:hypothetical protein
MKGWIYRSAVDIKKLGERIRTLFIGRFIRDIGLALRGWVLDHSTVGEVVGNFQNQKILKRIGGKYGAIKTPRGQN